MNRREVVNERVPQEKEANHPDPEPSSSKMDATTAPSVLSRGSVAGEVEHGLDQPGAGLPHGRSEFADELVRRGGARRLDAETFGQFDPVRRRVVSMLSFRLGDQLRDF